MNYETLNLRIDDGIARVILNRPEVRNAFNAQMIEDLTYCFAQLAVDSTLRAVILAGEGKVFCAGADVNWMKESVEFTTEQNRVDAMRMARMYQAIDQCPVPVIARIQKAVFGGAVGLTAVSDIAVATDDTKFSFSEVRLGIVPAVISSFSLRKVGITQARRYFLTGEVFDAPRAKEIGLIHESVPESELDSTVIGLIHEILKNGPQAVREAKVLAREVPELAYEAALEYCADTISRIRTSEEGQEGLKAFLEKRKASWIADSGS
jgi:methylglutaconyl-CoA hydratase